MSDQPRAGHAPISMKDHKIVFTGTPGAGKSTAIASLSDTTPITTHKPATDAGPADQLLRISLDDGQIDLGLGNDRGHGHSVKLISTPGHPRFASMWRTITTDALGLVILIDNSRPAPWDDLAMYLDAYKELLPTMNCVVGIGRTAEHPQPSPDDYGDMLAGHGLAVPVMPVDVRQRSDVLMLVEAVLVQAGMRT